MFAFAPLSRTLPYWPKDLFGEPGGLLDEIGVTDFRVVADDAELEFTGTVAWLREIELKLPSLDAVSVAFLSTSGFTQLDFRLRLAPDFQLTLINLKVAIRLRSGFLRPVHKNSDGKWVPTLDTQGQPVPAEFELSGVDATVSADGDIAIVFPTGAPSLSLPPLEFGSTGIVLEMIDIQLYLSEKQTPPAGAHEGFKGLAIKSAILHLSGGLGVSHAPDTVAFTNLLIGSAGFSGRIQATWAASYDAGAGTFSGTGGGKLFGLEFGLESLDFTFQQNVPKGAALNGEIKLPFFDEPVQVEIGIGVDGDLLVALGSTGSDGLYNLSKPGLLDLELDSIAFELQDGVFTTKLSGKLTPLFGGLNWPSFDVKELSIDSKGNVHLDGGWLDLPKQYTLDFYGFKIEIAQLGFGKNDDGSKWIGFSGGLSLVDGLRGGASVEGLRITWFEDGSDPKISLNGAGVEMEIPGVLYLKGEVSFNEVEVGGEIIRRFDGDIHLALETPEIEIDGTLVIGSVKGPQGRYNFFAIYVDVDLPTGIPLAATGLGLYGFAGLLALQMEPNKRPDEMWFSIDHSKSYYHRDEPGITDLKKKWDPRKGSFAVGVGVTLATLADNGTTFNGKFLLAIVVPGPIVLIQGAASFLKKRAEGKDEGQFRALTVIDGREGSLLIGIDAEYKTGKGGELIEIGGSMEAFYAFHDPTAWHLYLGRNEPRELRIRALFGRFVEANAYFMLDAHQLALGAWFGYKNGWIFGPLSVRLEAWADGNALLSFKPTHFHGDLSLHALVDLKVFGLGLGLALDAKIAADLFKPFHLRGDFSVGIKLPWPFKKKIGATVTLEWGPRKVAPPLPLPVTQVAVEHLKSTAVWPLPRGKYLRPNWDDGGGFLAAPVGALQPPDLAKVPLVPLDARLSVTFGRSVHDEAKVGINLQPVIPAEEEIGHPGGVAVAKVRYVLESLELRRWDGGSWQLAARSPKPSGGPALFGSWMPVPQLPDAGSQPPRPGQTKLLLWSKSPFDFTRATGSSWEEWVSDALPDYPCIPLLPAEETCFGFEALPPGTLVESPWTHPGPPAFTLSWGFGPAKVVVMRVPEAGVVRTVTVLCFPAATVRRGVRIRCSEPGRSFRIVFAGDAAPAPAPTQPLPVAVRSTETTVDSPACVDLRARPAGTVANPWSDEGVRFAVRGVDGELLPLARLERWGKGPLGLNAGFRLDVELPCASAWVELIVTHRPPFRVIAFNGAGVAVAIHAPLGTRGETTETIRLEGPAIKRLEVHAAGNEKLVHRVCYVCTRPLGPFGTGHGVDGTEYGPFFPVDGTLVVTGPEMPEVVVTGDGPLCIEKICVTPDPEAGQTVRREEMIQHIREQLARWESEGAVLAPHTAYRLTVRTRVEPTALVSGLTGFPNNPDHLKPEEHAYFRTGGPPGLTLLDVPEGVDTSKPFDSGLDDLVRYVQETDPPTVPPPGEKPLLFRPFYRAYDVGVEFNEDYVEQMYRMDRRDLGLYLYDNSNQPVRDARGRLLVLGNRWGKAEALILSEKETRWITLIDGATCLPKKLDPETFAQDSALASSDADRVLEPDTLHEARLVPLLLHEAFAGATLGAVPPGWYVDDAGPGGPSSWQAGEVGEPPSRFVEQGSPIGGTGPERPGTVLLLADPPHLAAGDPGRPSEWTDCRVSAYVRSKAGGAVGLVVRQQGPGTGYRFSLDGRVRRLVKLESGGVGLLAEDHFAYQRNRDYRLTVEVLGTSLRAYLDGEPVFEVTDAAYDRGRVGLYACQSAGARFADLAVDDLGRTAPVVYRFEFTTSLYANFFHHLHSFQDETWKADLGADPAVAPLLNEAVIPSFSAPTEPEARAYEELAEKALGPAARQNPQRVEMTRVERDGQAPLFWLRSPEPLDWKRVELALSRSGGAPAGGAAPGDLKLTEVARGAARPEEESVTLLLREAADLTRHRIELRQLPGPLSEPSGDPVLWLESFQQESALERFTIVDAAGSGGPSLWAVEGGGLVEISGVGGGNEPELPGTQALFGDGDWQDYRLTVDLRGDSGGALGVVFRYRDDTNYYRLSLDAALSYRRLVKCVAGEVTVLWEDGERYAAGEPFRLVVEAVGQRLVGYLGETRLFEVRDGAHASGTAGIYAAANPGARCESIEVRRPSLEARAWLADRFGEGDLGGWGLFSEVPSLPLAQSAAWETSGSALRLESLLAHGGDPAYPGAYAAAGDPAWTDVVLQVRLRSTGGAIGVVVRGRDLAHLYRFSMSGDHGYRQLIKKVGGSVTVLWRDAVAYEADRAYELTIVALGSSLRGYLDGVPLFAVEDGDVPAGRIGLYAWSNQEAWFSEVRVWPGDQAFDRWSRHETFEVLAPERWSFLDEGGEPEPGLWTVEGGALAPGEETAVWTEPGGGLDGPVHALAPSGGDLFVGGEFSAAGSTQASRIAVWDGASWSALGAGVNGSVRAIAVVGNQVFVGGRFTEAGGAPAANVAVWNRAQKTWSALGTGVNGPVFALAVSGRLVYAGGRFSLAGGAQAANIAAWNRQSRAWTALGVGVDAQVLALAVREGSLYVGGRFNQAGGQPASKVARWSAGAWAAASGTIDGPVTALAVGEDGLYIAGAFTHAAGVVVNRIARRSDTGWAPLGEGLDGEADAITLEGTRVWVGGRFTLAGGQPASRLARWNRVEEAWTIPEPAPAEAVLALAADEDLIYAGGQFTAAGGEARHLAALALGGSLYAVAAQPEAAEFRLAVRLVPEAEGAAGVVFAWRDAAHHLALWLDAENGRRRLVRTEAGKVEVLWEDAARPEAGREQVVTIDVFGGRLVGHLDGVEVFALDAMPLPGRVGLAARRSPGVRFRELLVAEPEWTCWHGFGEEERMPAGSRVRVHAGPPTGSAGEAGLHLRSAALAGERGRLRLPVSAATLRIAGPGGLAGHVRSFLPDSGYTAVPVRVLRRADGTGCLLIPEAFPAGAAGTLRLGLTYHRERPEAGRSMSQAGDRGPERVVLDIREAAILPE